MSWLRALAVVLGWILLGGSPIFGIVSAVFTFLAERQAQASPFTVLSAIAAGAPVFVAYARVGAAFILVADMHRRLSHQEIS